MPRFKKLSIADNIYQQGTVVTAGTGFAIEANMKYLHERQINGYIPDNRFRSRDPKFQNQKDKYGKRHQNQPDTGWENIIPASEFQLDPVTLTCICPAGQELHYEATRPDGNGVSRAYFKGRLLQCRHCPKKHQCMQNPASDDHRKGSGRQVNFALERNRGPAYTDWMKHRGIACKVKKSTAIACQSWNPYSATLERIRASTDSACEARKKKVQGQWQLYCRVHNIDRLANYGQLAA